MKRRLEIPQPRVKYVLQQFIGTRYQVHRKEVLFTYI